MAHWLSGSVSLVGRFLYFLRSLGVSLLVGSAKAEGGFSRLVLAPYWVELSPRVSGSRALV